MSKQITEQTQNLINVWAKLNEDKNITTTKRNAVKLENIHELFKQIGAGFQNNEELHELVAVHQNYTDPRNLLASYRRYLPAECQDTAKELEKLENSDQINSRLRIRSPETTESSSSFDPNSQ